MSQRFGADLTRALPGFFVDVRSRADVVAVGAHPDDVDMAVGGTLLSLKAQGYKTAILDLTDGEPTPKGDPKTRRAEARKSARKLGAARIILDFPNRELMDTVEVRKALAVVLRHLRPWMLILPYPRDAHPDHWAASAASMAGRFYGKLTKTSMSGKPWWVPRILFHHGTHLRHAPEPSMVMDISPFQKTKTLAVSSFRSQFHKVRGRNPIKEIMEDRGRHYGNLIGARYGEPFFSWEPLGWSSFDSMVLPGYGTLGRQRGKKR